MHPYNLKCLQIEYLDFLWQRTGKEYGTTTSNKPTIGLASLWEEFTTLEQRIVSPRSMKAQLALASLQPNNFNMSPITFSCYNLFLSNRMCGCGFSTPHPSVICACARAVRVKWITQVAIAIEVSVLQESVDVLRELGAVLQSLRQFLNMCVFFFYVCVLCFVFCFCFFSLFLICDNQFKDVSNFFKCITSAEMDPSPFASRLLNVC